MIILKNNETISNQLGNLENKNILSYIDPDILFENNTIIEKYAGKLFMKNNSNEIIPFKIYLLMNYITNKFTDTDPSTDFIDSFKDSFTENFERIKDILLGNLPNNSGKLDSYKSADHRELYNEYKQKLLENQNKNYDSENNLINEIYNFNTTIK